MATKLKKLLPDQVIELAPQWHAIVKAGKAHPHSPLTCWALSLA